MLKKIAIVLVLVLAGFAAFVATRPSDFRITRERTLAAPPGVVHPFVSDFHRWPEWSPWEKLDPAMKREVGGAPAGAGATYHWVGNNEVGEGRMTITDSQPPRSVTINLEFIKPFAATHTTRFDIEPSGSGSKVTWTMDGQNNFMSKAFGVFMDIDKMVGADFEKGLLALDGATAAAAAAAAKEAPVASEPAATPVP